MISDYLVTRQNLFFKWSGLFIVLIFLTSFIFRVTYIPNQLILLASGVLLLTLIFLPLFLFVNLKNLDNRVSVWVHIAGLFFCFLLIWVLFIWHIVPIIHAQFRVMPFSQAQIIFVMVFTGIGSLAYFLLFLNRNVTKNIRADGVYFILVFTLSIIFTALNFPLQVQAPDRLFNPDINNPVYSRGDGPLIYIDEGHCNFHTLRDRLITTGRILRNDGYVVESYRGEIEKDRLSKCKILVIVNALNKENQYNWSNPTYSAFTPSEIDIIHSWVNEGGSLFLIADHMPMPGAVAALASRFGFELENGHASDTLGLPDYFTRASGTLADDKVTNGRILAERVDSILTFGGHAFRYPEEATSFMTFDSLYFQWNPEQAWQFEDAEPYSIYNYSQGAYRTFGKGRIVVLGEAMMVTAQLGAGLSMIKMGMNTDAAPYNYQLLLNIIHWLDNKISS